MHRSSSPPVVPPPFLPLSSPSRDYTGKVDTLMHERREAQVGGVWGVVGPTPRLASPSTGPACLATCLATWPACLATLASQLSSSGPSSSCFAGGAQQRGGGGKGAGAGSQRLPPPQLVPCAAGWVPGGRNVPRGTQRRAGRACGCVAPHKAACLLSVRSLTVCLSLPCFPSLCSARRKRRGVLRRRGAWLRHGAAVLSAPSLLASLFCFESL